ncbi:uncharacterized protein N7479_003294 [Penicillium vulpinum]|uniref:SMP domain-containing protein n=1 Tax=Penicillium vulpinum TaxID=29845 RepID=A0A1V6S3M1_9EURO|nr:uncharacterized protein N7479_003294 [Penicillium vulpinum]KAJ5963418.1 hypothetical protein N7479_003294 [Penicillium vulpinum]OQE08446.1 hypothetical protein PENVUL_c009G08670 [Penicillium vulpinum]
MARFSLSFIAIFLVLAVFTISMPTKRDQQTPTQMLGLDGTVGKLMHATSLMDGLDKNGSSEEEKQKAHDAAESNQKKQEAKVAAKLAEKAGAVDQPPVPATSTKKLSSGDFMTPTATPTPKPTSQANALGNIPIIGGLLGGAGGGL